MMIDEDYKKGFFCGGIPEYGGEDEDELTPDRLINPLHADEYLQRFPPYILPLYNTYRYLNNCASREKQLYTSRMQFFF